MTKKIYHTFKYTTVLLVATAIFILAPFSVFALGNQPFGHQVIVKPAPLISCSSSDDDPYLAFPVKPYKTLFIKSSYSNQQFTSFGQITPSAWMLGFLGNPTICTIDVGPYQIPISVTELSSYGTSR
jgi:hypothetical protein